MLDEPNARACAFDAGFVIRGAESAGGSDDGEVDGVAELSGYGADEVELVLAWFDASDADDPGALCRWFVCLIEKCVADRVGDRGEAGLGVELFFDPFPFDRAVWEADRSVGQQELCGGVEAKAHQVEWGIGAFFES